MTKKKLEVKEELEQPEIVMEDAVIEDPKPEKIEVKEVKEAKEAKKKDIEYIIADSTFIDKLLEDLYFRVPDSYENIYVTADLNYVRPNRASYLALLALRVVKPGGRVRFSKEFKPFLNNYVEEGDFIILVKEG